MHQISATDFRPKQGAVPLPKRLTLLPVPTARLARLNNLKHGKVYEVGTVACHRQERALRTLPGTAPFDGEPPAHLLLDAESGPKAPSSRKSPGVRGCEATPGLGGTGGVARAGDGGAPPPGAALPRAPPWDPARPFFPLAPHFLAPPGTYGSPGSGSAQRGAERRGARPVPHAALSLGRGGGGGTNKQTNKNTSRERARSQTRRNSLKGREERQQQL